MFQSTRTAESQTTQDDKVTIDKVQEKVVEQQKNQTCDKDTAVTTINFCKQPFMFKALNPFKSQVPNEILGRQYKVLEFAITEGFGYQQLNFPNCLLAIPAIQRALSSFYYFRSDVEVDIKINSTPYHQGMMQITFLHDNRADLNYSQLQRSAQSAMYLNYSSSDSVCATYGWLHPSVYMRLSFPPVSADAYIGTMTFTPVLQVDNTSGGVKTIYCTVFARFLNPRTAGFVPAAPVMGQSGKSFKFNYAPETEEKSMTLLPTSNSKETILSPLFKAIPLVEGTVSNVIDLFSHLTTMLDKTQDIASPQRMQYGMGSDNITGSGVILADRLTLYPTSRLARFPISPECHSSEMPVVQLAQQPMHYDTFKFTASTALYQIPCHPLTVGKLGINEALDVVQPDYLCYVTSMHRYWKGSLKYLLYFVTNAFTTARFRISYVQQTGTPDVAYGGDIPSQIIEIKGSTKTPITVPYLWETPYRPTVPLGEVEYGFQQSPQLLIEMLTLPVASQGDEPYISMVVFRAAGEDFQLASPCSSVIYPALVYPTTPSALKKRFDRTSNSSKVKGQTSLQQEFKFKFPPIACDCSMVIEQGFTTTETVGKCDDLLKRMYQTIPGTEPSILVTNPLNPGQPVLVGGGAGINYSYIRQPQYMLKQLFKYQRGSMRWRYIQEKPVDTETEDQIVYITPSTQGAAVSAGSGDLLWVRTMNPIQTVEVPWIGTVPYYPMDAGSQSIRFTQIMELVSFDTTPLGDNTTFLEASGDDRTYSYLLPPPTFQYVESLPKINTNTIPKAKG